MCKPKREQHIRQDISDTGVADQRHFPGRCCGGERVMNIPKRMLEPLKEIVGRYDTAFSRGALKTRPVTRQNCQRSQPSLRVIYRPRAAKPPGVSWQNEPLQFITVRPPA